MDKTSKLDINCMYACMYITRICKLSQTRIYISNVKWYLSVQIVHIIGKILLHFNVPKYEVQFLFYDSK